MIWLLFFAAALYAIPGEPGYTLCGLLVAGLCGWALLRARRTG